MVFCCLDTTGLVSDSASRSEELQTGAWVGFGTEARSSTSCRIASRYTAPPSLRGGGLLDVHVDPLELVLHLLLLEGRHLGGHRHRAGVVVVPALVLEGKTSVEPLGPALQAGVGDPEGERVEGSLGAHHQGSHRVDPTRRPRSPAWLDLRCSSRDFPRHLEPLLGLGSGRGAVLPSVLAVGASCCQERASDSGCSLRWGHGSSSSSSSSTDQLGTCSSDFNVKICSWQRNDRTGY